MLGIVVFFLLLSASWYKLYNWLIKPIENNLKQTEAKAITPLLSLSVRAIARSLTRQSIQPILLEKNCS